MGEILQKLIFQRVEEPLKRVEGGVGIDLPDDGAIIPVGERRLVVSTDSYTVNPIFFPGGNIGILAACGSINDVLMMGARPIAMLDCVVVEEGFPVDELSTIINSMLDVLRKEGIPLVGGDFKVMPRGMLDRVVITTTCIGEVIKPIVDANIRVGDRIIVSGNLGEHGAAILMSQKGLEVEAELKSDVRALTELMIPLLEEYGAYINAARDPTRGGLAMLLNDWARVSGTTIVIEEGKIPLRTAVRKYAEMLGIDPLSLASEGVAVLAVDGTKAEEIVQRMRELGFERASVIGEVKKAERLKGVVVLKTAVGGYRILEPPIGELVPRIC